MSGKFRRNAVIHFARAHAGVTGPHFIDKLADDLGIEKPGFTRLALPVVVLARETHPSADPRYRHLAAVYDAVRGWEAQMGGSDVQLESARKVDFAPPRSRAYTENVEGNELADIIALK